MYACINMYLKMFVKKSISQLDDLYPEQSENTLVSYLRTLCNTITQRPNVMVQKGWPMGLSFLRATPEISVRQGEPLGW